MYKIGDLELPSLVLYGDEAEEVMTSYLDFRDAYISYNASFMPISKEESKKVIKEVALVQELKTKSEDLRKRIPKTESPLEKQKLNEEASQLELDLVKAIASIKDVDNLIDQSYKYTPEKRKEIKEAEKLLKEITNEILELFSVALKQEDKKTPFTTLEKLKNLPKGLKYKLIMDVATEPLNGISASFLASLERVVSQVN